MVKSTVALLVTMLGTVVMGLPAIAQPELEFNSQTPSFEDSLSLGNIRVQVNYEASETLFESDVNYILYYQDKAQLQEQRSEFMLGKIWLQDLTGDDNAEVIVETYSGGAHCCTIHEVYTWTGEEFEEINFGYRDGNGGEFQDLDNDEVFEYLTFDGAFLYAFSSYAGSFPPSQILRIGNNGLEDVTREYPERLRGTAWQMYQSIQSRDYELNGILAGYVAQKMLLGEFEEGWEFMLARYDRTSDQGLDIRNSKGEVIGQYPDFPTALRAFLTENGYFLSP
ncbi:hypothetical protein [Oscillatoria acuminata]|uniref:Uncharacterized protein n=1 Tax=Oscillatoria acuminata PCC 6304 TaxID=56110 RepID=K9TH37_9CYAN|nr:hypothetical protein [Oscillatoria acuminata]AFY81718.1 hypothetical protein Oscil6304_2051 [Oscillatoria acuminata PCC 6304]